MCEKTDIITQQNFTTKVQRERIHFQWDGLRFNDILYNHNIMHLQKIYLESQDKSKWHISLDATIQQVTGIDIMVKCKLESATTDLKRLAIWEFVLINGDGETVREFNMENNYEEETFFHHMQEEQIASSGVFFPDSGDDILRVKGHLSIYSGTKQIHFSKTFLLSSFEKSSLLKLQGDMSDLFVNATDDDKADVELCTDDGTVLHAHRNILVARSEYFRAMLSSGMMEQRTGKISIEGVNGKAMKALLHFLYSGRLSLDWSDSKVLQDFTKAAHRYQIMALVEFLDANIVTFCDPRSAKELLLLCKTLGMKTAEDGLRRLIQNNLEHIDGVTELDDLLLLIAKRQNIVD